MTVPPADRCRKKKTFEGGQKHVFHLPNEVFAVAAERRLLEEARNEAMVLNVVNVFLFQRTLASPVAEVQLVVRIVILIALVVSHFHSSRSAFLVFYLCILTSFTRASPPGCGRTAELPLIYVRSGATFSALDLRARSLAMHTTESR